jgi:natural product biosynthesis luciferase-like monooxygenase protein
MFFAEAEKQNAAAQYNSLLSCVAKADKVGLHAVWIPERHYHSFGGLFPNPAILGAAIATHTSKISIRAGSVVTPLHNPVSTVEAWSVVDNLSAGRIQLSLASGWNPVDFCLVPDRFDARREITFKHVDLLRNLWREGHHMAVLPDGSRTDVGIHPRPVQPELPLWLTSSGNRETFRVAGGSGVGVLTHMLGQNVESLATKISEYRRANLGASSLPCSGKVAVMVHTMLGNDRASVINSARRYLFDYFSSSLDLEMRSRGMNLDVSMRTQLLNNRVEHHLSNTSFIGDARGCADLLEKLAAAGVDEVACLVDFGPSESEIMETIDHLPLLLDMWPKG